MVLPWPSSFAVSYFLLGIKSNNMVLLLATE